MKKIINKIFLHKEYQIQEEITHLEFSVIVI
jgi:hypothetical protein